MGKLQRKWPNKNNVFVFVASVFRRYKCTMLLGNSNQSHNNKTVIELACSVRTGKILVEFCFAEKELD